VNEGTRNAKDASICALVADISAVYFYGEFTVTRGNFEINTSGANRIKNSYSRALLLKQNL
jgi:hypothetical protein